MSRSFKSKKQKIPYTCCCYYCNGDFSKYLKGKDNGKNQMLESDLLDIKELSKEEESADQMLYYLSGEDTYADWFGQVISEDDMEHLVNHGKNKQQPLVNSLMEKEKFSKLWKEMIEDQPKQNNDSGIVDTCSDTLSKALKDAEAGGRCLAIEVPKL